MCLHKVLTPREIELIYALPEGSVRRDLSRSKFRPSEIRKSGRTWLITAREAHRVYTGELTFIPVKDDFEWVLDHVREELKNDTLNDLVRRVLDKPFMNNNDVKNLAGLYHEGLQQGIENGKYIPFAQWFYEHFEDRIEEVLEEMNKKERVKQAFLEVHGSDTDWSLAADRFIEWIVSKDFQTESFDDFVEEIDDNKIDDTWDFFYGYGSDFERFAADWVDEEEREEYLKFAKGANKMEKIKAEKILHILKNEDFPDDRYVVGEANGKYFFAWGGIPDENGMVPSEDVAERGAGIRWYDLLSELRREELRDFGEWRVFEEAEAHGFRFAILVDDLTMEAAWAIWREELNRWDTDFSLPHDDDEEYWSLSEFLDPEAARALGYRFEDEPGFVVIDEVIETYEDSAKTLCLLRSGSEYAIAWGQLFPTAKEVPHSDVFTSESGIEWFRNREEAKENIERLKRLI